MTRTFRGLLSVGIAVCVAIAERWERPALWSPGSERNEQVDPRLLRLRAGMDPLRPVFGAGTGSRLARQAWFGPGRS